MSKLIFQTILVAVFLIPCFAQENKSTNINGKVEGSVFDITGEAIIPNYKVTVEGNNIKQISVTGENGQFEFDLPAGIYHISTEANWYYPLKRASFQIKPNTTSIINIYPSNHITSIALTVTDSGVRDIYSYAKQPKYEIISVSKISPLALVVQFDKKKIVKEKLNIKTQN